MMVPHETWFQLARWFHTGVIPISLFLLATGTVLCKAAIDRGVRLSIWIINQQPKFCAIIFSKINPDAHVSTKIHSHFTRGVWG